MTAPLRLPLDPIEPHDLTDSPRDRLRRLAPRLHATADPDARWLAAALDRHRLHGEPLETCLGLSVAPAVPSVVVVRADTERWHESLRRLAARQYSHLPSARETATAMATDWARYEAGPWQHQRGLSEPPERYRGKAGELWWHLTRTTGRALGAEVIRKALSRGYEKNP